MKIGNFALHLKKIIKYIRIFLRAPLHLIYFLSCFSPRDKKVWIFGSGATGERFADNAKYFFLYVANNCQNEIRSIWISQKRDVVKILNKNGYKAYWSNNPRAIFFSLRAKYFIIDTFSSTFGFCYWFSGKAKKINFYHGIPLKKIAFDDNKSIIYNLNWFKQIIFRIFIPWTVEKWDMIISTSNFFKEIAISAFLASKERVIIAGQPRNDIFFKKIKGSLIGNDYPTYNNLIDIKKKRPQTKVLIYAPTFRDTNRDFIKSANFNLKRLNQLLESHNSFLIIKLHPFTKIKIEKTDFSKIIFLAPAADIYPFFFYTDILITDYSSIYFDFLLLDKPIIFFPFDFEEYQDRDREFYFDYNKFTPGPKAYNFQELINWIGYFLKGNDEFKNEREKIKNICFEYKDGNSSERIFKYIKSNP